MFGKERIDKENIMISRSCSDIEDAFQYISFAQAVCTMYILCSTLLLMSTVKFNAFFLRNYEMNLKHK